MPTSTANTEPPHHLTSTTNYLGPSGYELQKLLAHARELMCEPHMRSLDNGRLEIIVRAAVEAKNLLFIAAVDEPTPAELEDIFEDFIRRALVAGDGVR